MVIVLGGSKNGIGKTTILTNLAILFAKKGEKVLIIDTDPTNPLQDFIKARKHEKHEPEIDCINIRSDSIGTDIVNLRPKYNVVFVDVCNENSSIFKDTLLAANILLLPFSIHETFSWDLEKMDDLIGEVLRLSPELKVISFFNKIEVDPLIDTQKADEEKFIKTVSSKLKNIPHPEIRIGSFLAFRQAFAEGASVQDLKQKDKRGINNILELYNVIIERSKWNM